MPYADYAYYTGTYLGTAITEQDFPKLSLRASSFLDYYTRGKAAHNADLDALKMACCAVAEQYQMIDTANALASKSLASAVDGGGELQSQTVGSWSKTYRSGGDSAAQATAAAASLRASLASVAAQYLTSTNLLYRGRCGCVSAYCDAL